MDIQTSLLGLSTFQENALNQTVIGSDIPLPAGRDAAEVLSCCGFASVDRADCCPGEIRVVGRLTLYLVCRALSGDIFGFTAESGFSQSMAVERAAEGMQAQASAQVMECTAAPDALRLKLSAVLELSAQLCAPVTAPFITDVIGDAALQKLPIKFRTRRKVRLGEGTLRLREELEGRGVVRVLLCRGTAQVLGVTLAGTGACQAEGQLIVTALTENEGGELAQQTLTLPFTCGVEAAYVAGAWAVAAVDALQVSAADVSFGLLDVEAALRLTFYGIEETETAALSDAYDLAGSFSCRRESLAPLSCRGVTQQLFTFSENVMLPKHLPDAARPVYAGAMAVVTGLTERNGQLGADVMLLTTLIYLSDEGKLLGFTEDIPAQLDFSVPFCPESRVTVSALSVTPGGGGRTLTVQYQLLGMAEQYAAEPVTLAAELLPDGSPCPYSGLLIYCADGGETLWDVGKRFQVSMEDLSGLNGCQDPLNEGQAVVLMK